MKNKLIFFLLTVELIICLSVSAQTLQKGDVNGDGVVNVADVVGVVNIIKNGPGVAVPNETDEDVKLLNMIDPYTITREDQEKQLVFLWYSDIHGDVERMRRLYAYKNKISNYLDDVLFNGDLAGSSYPGLKKEVLGWDDFKSTLFVLGNHDTYNGTGSNYASQSLTVEQCYKAYMQGKVSITDPETEENNIAGWGVVQPQGAGQDGYYPCYYYKDYPLSKMRLVVLDCMHWDTTQESWLADILAETLDNTKDCYGYHIIGCQHYLMHNGTADVKGFDTPFNSYDDYKLQAQKTGNNSAYIVQKFINNGGVFVCWLAGHLHTDFCGVLTKYPKQIYIAIGSASLITPAQDCARVKDTDTQDLFNIIGFDYYSKTIKVMRVGAKRDRYLRNRDVMCIEYGDNPRIRYTS